MGDYKNLEKLFDHIDCNATDEIVCPHCGYEVGGGHDALVDNITEGKETCPQCNKEFKFYAEFEVTFSTERIE